MKEQNIIKEELQTVEYLFNKHKINLTGERIKNYGGFNKIAHCRGA